MTQYPEDMWRCYDPRFYGGKAPEEDRDVDQDGLPIYWRAPFPGQPFRDNAFDENREPVTVCTPSLRNAAPSTTSVIGALLVAVSVIVAILRDPL